MPSKLYTHQLVLYVCAAYTHGHIRGLYAQLLALLRHESQRGQKNESRKSGQRPG